MPQNSVPMIINNYSESMKKLRNDKSSNTIGMVSGKHSNLRVTLDNSEQHLTDRNLTTIVVSKKNTPS